MAKGKQRKVHLPPEIILDILSRIPVENLIPLRCISKKWYELVYDPFFVNAHTHHVRPKPGFIFQSTLEKNTIIFIDAETKKRKSFNFKPKSGSSDCITTIHASCNGLILLGTREDLYVYNPVLHHAIALPQLTQIVDESICLWSLAYNSTAKKYKVVCGRRGNDGYECYIITVGEECKSWRKVMIPPPHCLCVFPPVYANGFLHWMIHSKEIENLEGNWSPVPQSEGRVLTLDVAKEVFDTRVHPHCELGVYTLLEMDGALCFADHVGNSQLKIWVLKNLEEDEWEKVFSIDLGTVLPFQGFLVDAVPVLIICGHEFKIIIKCFDDFYCYDVKFKALKHLMLGVEWRSEVSEFEERFSPFRHVNTLLSWN